MWSPFSCTCARRALSRRFAAPLPKCSLAGLDFQLRQISAMVTRQSGLQAFGEGLGVGPLRGSLITSQSLLDHPHHGFRIVHNLTVPESNDPISLRGQVCRAVIIMLRLLHVLASIQLNHQAAARRAEIRYIGTDGMLTAEVYALLAQRTQRSPELLFGWCQVLTKFPGAMENSWSRSPGRHNVPNPEEIIAGEGPYPRPLPRCLFAE